MNSLSSYILVAELVYKRLSSYILVPELVYKQSWFLYTCIRAGV